MLKFGQMVKVSFEWKFENGFVALVVLFDMYLCLLLISTFVITVSFKWGNHWFRAPCNRFQTIADIADRPDLIFDSIMKSRSKLDKAFTIIDVVDAWKQRVWRMNLDFQRKEKAYRYRLNCVKAHYQLKLARISQRYSSSSKFKGSVN